MITRGDVEGIEYKNAEFLEDFGIFKKGDQYDRIIISITTGEFIVYGNAGKMVQPFAMIPRKR